jgi:hypothetical protein
MNVNGARPSRRPREGGDPAAFDGKPLDSRLRGNDITS